MTILMMSIVLGNAAVSLADEPAFYVKKFIVSAYYSPLPNQEHYYTGSFAAETRLNGRGTNGASGKEVYPGMIAAPKAYPFGTKMDIPGVGIVSVQDRGGAIKSADGKRFAHDRLDIWMGKGETGLKKALAWGKRVVEVKVYGVSPNINESVNLDNLQLSNISRYKSTIGSRIFSDDVYFMSSGANVKKLQDHMSKLGFFNYPITGFYGDVTRESVINFQIAYGIIEGEDDFGAGHFGVNSRCTLDKIIYDSYKPQKKVVTTSYPDLKETTAYFSRPLKLGAEGNDVRALQTELNKLGFLRIEPTGYFGETTEHAVFKFQQYSGLVEQRDNGVAGYVGPATRKALNDYIDKRISIKGSIASKRDQIIAANKANTQVALNK